MSEPFQTLLRLTRPPARHAQRDPKRESLPSARRADQEGLACDGHARPGQPLDLNDDDDERDGDGWGRRRVGLASSESGDGRACAEDAELV